MFFKKGGNHLNTEQPVVNQQLMQPSKRIMTLDVLRGLALFGILIANMLHFQSPYIYIDPHTFYNSPIDALTFKWIDILVEGSFYPIFAMLFGYGINMQYEKGLAQNRSTVGLMLRRFSLLMVFGLIHAIFIWSGDILFTYAIYGFLMILIVRIPKRILLILSVALFTVTNVLLYAVTYLIAQTSGAMEEFVDIQQIELAITAYAHGTYLEALQFRVGEWLIYGLLNSVFAGFLIVPLMMFGVVFSKWKLIERGATLWKVWLVFILIFGPLGFYFKALPYLKEPRIDYDILQTAFGGPFVGLFYMGLVVLLMATPLQKILQFLAPVGKMSLTIYIMQSIVATLIFNHYGLGLYGKLDLSTGTWIAFGIFVIQIILANLWLARYERGPLEALWRKWTYRKL